MTDINKPHKPPDLEDIKKVPNIQNKYKVLKIPLKNIIRSKHNIPILFDANMRMNKLIIHVYQFLRLWILQKYNDIEKSNIKDNIPEITKDVILMAFKALAIKSKAGPNPKGDNSKYYEEFQAFYESTYKNLGYSEKIDGSNLSEIIGYATTSMVTAIENNIKLNFFKYIKRFVNVSFSEEHTIIIKKYKGKEKTAMRKQLKADCYKIYQDLLNNTRKSDTKYHVWIDIHRPLILPTLISKEDCIKQLLIDSFTEKHSNELKEYKKEIKLKKKEEFNIEIDELITDLMNDTKISNTKHHKWITEQRLIIDPNNLRKKTYIRTFVKRYIDKIHTTLLNTAINNLIQIKKEQFANELVQIKQDLLNNTTFSPKEYHEWINTHKFIDLPQGLFCLPIDYGKVTLKDVNDDPQRYMKYMIYINLYLETKGEQSYQFFPLRTNCIPKYIPIDTKSLVELFIKENPKKYYDNLRLYEDELWKTYFKMSNKIFKMKNYVFNHSISTDCYAVSIQFLHKDLVEAENKKKDSRLYWSNKSKEDTEEMSPEEKVIYKKEQKETKKNESKQIKDKMSADFKNLSKDEQNYIKNKKNKKKNEEFPYLDELHNEQISRLMFNSIYCDPGKRDLFTFIDDDENVFKYSNKRRMRETKRLKYQKLQQNYKNKHGIPVIESELTEFNSKSCNLINFKEYIKNKNRVNIQLLDAYSKPIFRQYKWYTYINTQRSEAKLLDEIEKKYAIKETDGKYRKLNIIMGDWCIEKQLRNFISTPNIHLKRLLLQRFNVYNFNEYNTSALHHATEEKCEHLSFTDNTNKLRKLHSVLTFTVNGRLGCINRDLNGVKNIRKLVHYWLDHGDRPSNYKKSSEPLTLIKAGA